MIDGNALKVEKCPCRVTLTMQAAHQVPEAALSITSQTLDEGAAAKQHEASAQNQE
jgi:hypothetical protein